MTPATSATLARTNLYAMINLSAGCCAVVDVMSQEECIARTTPRLAAGIEALVGTRKLRATIEERSRNVSGWCLPAYSAHCVRSQKAAGGLTMDCIIYDRDGTLLVLPANFRNTLNALGKQRFDEGVVLGRESGRELDEIAVESCRHKHKGEPFEISQVQETMKR